MNEIVDKTRVDLAVMAVDELTKCAQQIDLYYLHLGKMLAFVKSQELYKHYSEHTQTMSAFLREIDIGIGMSQCDHLIRIFRKFGERMNGRTIAFKRLLLISPMVTDDESADKWLGLAEVLPYRALVAEKQAITGKVPNDVCTHPEDSIQMHKRCSLCGCWLK